ncbi:putative integrase/recombinase y4rB [Bacteroidia bacterium]|nr:putative integrase/recombinase y4rB [Bacteroidia bacterium]
MSSTVKTRNHGIYADLIRQYIEYKRSLGFKMEDTDERLRRFDTLTIERKENKVGISKDLFDAWSLPFPEESECNRYSRMSILRGFSAYLQLTGYDSYMPRLPKYRSTFTPHIYTKQEMQSIFMECDKLFVRRRYMYSQACVMPTLVRMLYATGIRIGEAIKLKHKDIDLDNGYLVLRECKNGRDRAVPMSLSLKEVCKDYVLYKQSQGARTETEDFFFTAPDGSPCKTCTVYEIFRTVLFRSGISHGGRSKGPRLHDLRHTFCVNALVKMSEAGEDLYYSMPVIMTYMGHQSIEATNRYVRLTAEMYPDMLKKVDEAYKYIFPDIGVEFQEDEP